MYGLKAIFDGGYGSNENFIMDEISILQLLMEQNATTLKLILFDFLELPSGLASLSCCYYCEETTQDLKKCAKCRRVVYCGIECQRIDWKRHKGDCSSS